MKRVGRVFFGRQKKYTGLYNELYPKYPKIRKPTYFSRNVLKLINFKKFISRNFINMDSLILALDIH